MASRRQLPSGSGNARAGSDRSPSNRQAGIQLDSAGTFAGANWRDATVYLDAVRFSNAFSGELTFSEGIGGFTLVSAEAPEGMRVGFIAP
jgi:hypothetical protein